MRETSNTLNSRARHQQRWLAVLLLWGVAGGAQMACVFPQDDQIIPDLPGPSNRPLRVLQDLAQPELREATIKVDTTCPRTLFSIGVEDPNAADEIRARWFVDPNERYVADANKPALDGNAGTLLQPGSQVRRVTATMQFMNLLRGFADGRPHRVEVVVTDGLFQESEREDRTDGVVKPFLEVVRRETVRGPSGEVIPVTAYRDEYVWLVTIDPLPCP